MIDLSSQDEPIKVTRGDAWSLACTWTDETGTPIDMTGMTVAAQIRTSPNSTDVAATINCAITDAVGGQFTIGQDQAMNAGVYDVQITDSGGAKRTVMGGKFIIGLDVTRP